MIATTLATTCYLAIGAWMLIDMESRDRLGFRWTDAFVVLAAPAAAIGWAIWFVIVAVTRAVAAGCAILLRWCR